MKLVNPLIDDRLDYARQIIRGEAAALMRVADGLDGAFLQTIELIHRCPGRVCITGTGKSADVGQKIAGTLNSTGTRAFVLDVTRAAHGDLGITDYVGAYIDADPPLWDNYLPDAAADGRF